MTAEEPYGVRVEKKIDSMQKDIRMLSDHVTRLTFINEAHQSTSAENKKDIDAMSEKVRHLESQAAQLNGGLNVFRYISFGICSVLFAICGWMWGALNSNTKDVIKLTEKVTNIEIVMRRGDS